MFNGLCLHKICSNQATIFSEPAEIAQFINKMQSFNQMN